MKFDAKAQKNVKEYGGKGAPKLVTLTADDCRVLCSGAGIAYETGYEDRVIEYTLSDESVDRDGDVILQDGCDLENYKSNPVVLGFHNGREFPVARMIKVWSDGFTMGKETHGWVLFPDDSVDPTGETDRFFRFAKSGFMAAGSVGFRVLPEGYRSPDGDERKQRGMSSFGVVITKWELLEFSLCPVPANPRALAKAFQAGTLKKGDEAFSAELALGDTLQTLKSSIETMLREVSMGTKISKTHLDAVKAAHGFMEEAKDFHEKCMGKMSDAQEQMKDIMDAAEPDNEPDADDKSLMAALEKSPLLKK